VLSPGRCLANADVPLGQRGAALSPQAHCATAQLISMACAPRGLHSEPKLETGDHAPGGALFWWRGPRQGGEIRGLELMNDPSPADWLLQRLRPWAKASFK